jgi:hypothetical protein
MKILAVATWTFWLLILFIPAIRALTEPIGRDVTNEAIKNSARWPVFLWCLGWPIAFVTKRPAPLLSVYKLPLLAWTLGCAAFLLHIAVAFHLGHGWSHEAAWQHTKAVGGYGDGIYVNYLFALVWLADVIWMWAAFDSYLKRPRWLNWTIHGFLAFVVFNAAVVFGSRDTRLVFLITFGIVLALLAVGKWYHWKHAAQPNADAESGYRP